jgi:hypothetical protein
MAATAVIVMSACSKWTDMPPKGLNTLQTVDEIDLLLNYQYQNRAFGGDNVLYLTGDVSYLGTMAGTIPALIAQPTLDPVVASLLTWDEAAERDVNTMQDLKYTTYYEIIGKVANAALTHLDAASGDRAKADRLKAEAYVLRAYFGWLLVNYFAPAYNSATAATDGGVPYPKGTEALSEPNEKYTVQAVYDFITDDLKTALELNSLTRLSDNRMRVNQAFAYAVQAKVLMSMGNYTDAYTAASNSLAIEGTIDDWNTMLIEVYNPALEANELSLTRMPMTSKEDLFYALNGYLQFFCISTELEAKFEQGAIGLERISRLDDISVPFAGLQIPMFVDDDIYPNSGGISTIDMYLLQAECLIRDNRIGDAMQIINNIRRNRILTADYTELPTNVTAEEAKVWLKNMVATETWYSVKHFIDLKRWNTEPAWAETLHKHMEYTDSEGAPVVRDYTLTPESPLWIFPFPQNATSFNPNLSQNY